MWEDSGGEEEEGAAGHARSPTSEEVDAVKQGDPTIIARHLCSQSGLATVPRRNGMMISD